MIEMKSDLKIHVHIRHTAILMAVCLISTVILSLLFVMSSGRHWIQLHSLFQSRYEYSAMVEESIGIDDFHVYKAGIVFVIHPDAEYRVNADILMQTAESDYSDQIPWNADPLGSLIIAISKNLADENKLTLGDTLYSKHLSTDLLTEYTIGQIVPAVNAARIDEIEMTEGIIIMGYDQNYFYNIAHETVIFASKPVAELIEDDKVYPTRILYREDEITMKIKLLLLPIAAVFALSISISLFQASFTARLMLQNFKRLLLYGYPRRDLIIAWRKTFLGICLTVAVLSFFLNLIGSLVILESTVSVVMPCLIFMGQAAICFAMCYHHRVHAERC